MAETGKFAYITGGASGIARAVTTMLVGRGAKVMIADMNKDAAQAFADELNKMGQVAWVAQVNVMDWDQQVKAFESAVKEFGRVDYVYPIAGIGERAWTPPNKNSSGFTKPDLSVIEADLIGVLYTVSLAVQQFRRQEKDSNGFRGKIGAVASVCGFYCVPTLPVYTAAKHGVVGLTRSYGKYLPEEGITMNAVCPNVVKTSISTPVFYNKIEKMGLITPMQGLIEAFEAMLGDSKMSGECLECGPHGGYHIKEAVPWLDKESKATMDLSYFRSHHLQTGKEQMKLDDLMSESSDGRI